MAVQLDLNESTELYEDRDGLHVIRAGTVTGLTGSGIALLYNAVTTTGLPFYGDTLPGVPDVRLYEKRATLLPASTDQARIILHYKRLNFDELPPDDEQPPQISVGATVQTKETNMDINDDLIKVTYNGQEQTGTVELQAPMMTLQYSRRESEAPKNKAAQFVSTVNDAIWLDDEANTWLCTRIFGHSDDGGWTYKVDYEFQHDPETWDATVVYIDPATGEPPTDVEWGNGIDSFEVYPEANFDELNLT